MGDAFTDENNGVSYFRLMLPRNIVMSGVMDLIDTAISNVRAAAQAHGLAELARAAGLPYTTVKSFADRDWSHKNLETIRALNAAADRLASESAS